MKYLAILGRQPEISIAELDSLFLDVRRIDTNLALFSTGPATTFPPFSSSSMGDPQVVSPVDVNRLGGVLKLAIELEQKPLEYLQRLSEGKITIGVSDYSRQASRKSAQQEALKLKKILVRHGRSVRVVENKDAVLSTATSLHNGLSGKNERKVEFIKVDDEWYRVIGVQDIDAYAKRDQARPARDARVGMLPPKLAQILINLCGTLEPGSMILDPFCGTGVVLQEAILMGYRAYGTDISDRMIEYSETNLVWFSEKYVRRLISNTFLEGSVGGYDRDRKGASPVTTGASDPVPEKEVFEISQGDATSFHWNQPIDAVACEGYLGKPFSRIPTDIELKEQKQECRATIVGFLENLAGQIKVNTPVVIAVPAWLREDGNYERLGILDEIDKLGYNVDSKTREGLLYHRDGQVVARDILILRKK